MGQIDKYNIARLAEEALVRNLKPAIVKNIMKKLIDDFVKEAEPMVKAEAERITKLSVNHGLNSFEMKEEIKVYIEWVNKIEG